MPFPAFLTNTLGNTQMSALSGSTQLDDVLNRFQSQLDPRIASATQGEVHRWAEQVQELFNELHGLLIQQRGRVHDKLFRKARETNADAPKTVEDLKHADKKVEQLLAIVKSQIIVLTVESASDVEPRLDQNDLDPDIMLEFIDRGMELVNWIRKQEATISTWYEATFSTDV